MELLRRQAVETFLNSGEGKVLQIGRLPYRRFSFFIAIFLICLFIAKVVFKLSQAATCCYWMTLSIFLRIHKPIARIVCDGE